MLEQADQDRIIRNEWRNLSIRQLARKLQCSHTHVWNRARVMMLPKLNRTSRGTRRITVERPVGSCKLCGVMIMARVNHDKRVYCAKCAPLRSAGARAYWLRQAITADWIRIADAVGYQPDLPPAERRKKIAARARVWAVKNGKPWPI